MTVLDENHALKAQVQNLRARLEEGEELKRAISEGDLDALVFPGPEGDLIFTLNSADHAYRTLVETMNEGTVTLAFDGTILYCNLHFTELLRMPPQTIVGSSIYRFIAPENEIIFKALLEKGREKGEINLLAEGGISVPVYLSISSLRTKESQNTWCIVVTDMTAIKKSEEQIVLSEEKYRNILETANEGILIINDEAVVTYANKKLTDILGYSLEEGIGRPIWGFISEEGKDIVKLNIEKRRQGINGSYELKLVSKDGSPLWTLISTKALFDKDGKFLGSLNMLTDINERKKTEEVLKLKFDELARSNEELKQFAYILSHDLEEPLRMITSYLQLLQKRYQGNLDDKADKYIYFAVDGASRMHNRINDLLKFSQVTTSAEVPETTDCEFILNQVLSDLKVVIIENNATVSHDPLPVVMIDPTQLSQVFQNIIINGIKFHGEKSPKIHISAEKKTNEWLFSVQDNGIGIESQQFKRIFEFFKRLYKREEYPGTGMGLAICKKIIEKQGGRIWVESELGKGSTFYFTLPINPAEVQKSNF